MAGAPNTGYFLAQNFFDQIYGVAGVDLGALTANYIGVASGMVWGGNPPYTLSSFAAVYPKFFGAPSTFTGNTVAPAQTTGILAIGTSTITVGSAAGISDGWTVDGIGITPGTTVLSIAGNVVTVSLPALLNGTVPLIFADPVGSVQITGVNNTVGLAAGQFVTGANLADGTIITGISGTTVTLSRPTAATGTGTFTVYLAPLMPLVVIQMFINTAQASLMSARWCELWPLAMALYIAHFCTLWMRSETGPNSTAAQVVQSGLQIGMLTSKSVGDVSAGVTLLQGFLSEWGDFQLTLYGVQFATYAASIGAGPIWVGSGTGSPGGYYGGSSYGVF